MAITLDYRSCGQSFNLDWDRLRLDGPLMKLEKKKNVHVTFPYVYDSTCVSADANTLLLTCRHCW